MERKKIEAWIRDFNVRVFTGKIENAILYLEDLKKSSEENGYSNITLRNDDTDVSVSGQRYESDSEYSYRLKNEEMNRKRSLRLKILNNERKLRKDEKEDSERELYEKLKKKYGN